jgi:hypothetical protein
MKKLIFLFCLTLVIGASSGCVKEEPTTDKGIWGHGKNYTMIAQTPNTVTLRITSTSTFSADAMKAGETYPKVGETNPNKGKIEINIKERLIAEGLPITDNLLSMKLLSAVVTLDAARCNAVNVTIKNFSLPALLSSFSAVQSVGCDASRINGALLPYIGVEYAPELKAGGNVVVQYSYTTNADLPPNTTAASITMSALAVIKTAN